MEIYDKCIKNKHGKFNTLQERASCSILKKAHHLQIGGQMLIFETKILGWKVSIIKPSRFPQHIGLYKLTRQVIKRDANRFAFRVFKYEVLGVRV